MIETRNGHGHNVQTHTGGNQLDGFLIGQTFGHDATGTLTPCAGDFLIGGNIRGGLQQELFGKLLHRHLIKHGEHMVHRQNNHGQFLVEADAVVLLAVGACRFAVGAHNAHVREGVLGYILTLNGGVLGSLSANLGGHLRDGGSLFCRPSGRPSDGVNEGSSGGVNGGINQAQILM